ncbi:peroxisomal biogenesis factor 11 [Kockovaella imperatae]|uniref:Peroxisomal biogenesis factor 11 n=1 Tax=Kockovaella imperatae TaxID=4999 RepID=A0A1Y1UFA1_9TREE|nr:peroxisomal biogenesis factor 11 [Kockovaella imperatae]ORX36698.1 peroxisomal biogenesis factor 11 [Kockovaella imperatae]
MSALASSLILHPSLNQSLAVLATTNGRDKVYRLIQYLSRLIAWSYLRRGSLDHAAKWEGLMKGMAAGRRVMRLFKPTEFVQAALRLAQRPITSLTAPGQIAHLAQIGRQIGYAGFLGSDGLVWLGGIQFLRYDKEKIARLQRISYKCWLTGIFLSLVSTVASLAKLRADGKRFALSNKIARREAATSEKTPEEKARDEEERRQKGRALLAQRQTLLSQLVMDSCDIWIPATNLGYTSLNDGVLGILGATTSYMSLQTLWAKHKAAGISKV